MPTPDMIRYPSLIGRARSPAAFLLLWLLLSPGLDRSFAAIYTFEDEHGTVVMTNKPENVPGGHWTEATDPETGQITKVKEAGKPPAPSAGKRFFAGMKEFWAMFSLDGMTPQESRWLTLSFLAGVLMLAVMMLSQNQALRFMMRWMLILLVLGTTAKLYFTQNPMAEKAGGSAKQLQDTQNEKIERIQQLESLDH